MSDFCQAHGLPLRVRHAGENAGARYRRAPTPHTETRVVDTNLRANTYPVGKRCRGDPVGRPRGGGRLAGATPALPGDFATSCAATSGGRHRGGSGTPRGSVPVQSRRLYTGVCRGHGTAVPLQTPRTAWPTKTAAPRTRKACSMPGVILCEEAQRARSDTSARTASSSGNRGEELEHDAVERLRVLRVGNVAGLRNYFQTRARNAARHVLR